MSEPTVKYPASLVPVGAFAGKPAMPLTRPIVVVGSGKHARILLKSETVSSVHTLLIYSDGRWYFRDLVSRTHTILNGKSVRESALKNGDTITIGAFVFHFVAPESPEPSIPVAPAALDITDAELPVPIDTKTVLIGKRQGCEIRLLEEGVSTAHAVIFECNGRHFIRDLYSRNGTLLNGKKVHQEVLTFGDVVVVGETTIRYIPDQSVTAGPLAGNLEDSHKPAIALHDEAMESFEAPLVSRDALAMHEIEPASPAGTRQAPPPIIEVPAVAAEAPTPSAEAPRVEPRKPAEIRATLPPGLSSLLKEHPASAPSRPLSDVARRVERFPEPPTLKELKSSPGETLADEDDLVIPLRRREPIEEAFVPVEEIAESRDEPVESRSEAESTREEIDVSSDEIAIPRDEVETRNHEAEALRDEVEASANVEPSSIAPEVDEVRTDAEADRADQAERVTESDLVRVDDELGQSAVEPEIDMERGDVVERDDAEVASSPAVANTPLEAEIGEAQETPVLTEASSADDVETLDVVENRKELAPTADAPVAEEISQIAPADVESHVVAIDHQPETVATDSIDVVEAVELDEDLPEPVTVESGLSPVSDVSDEVHLEQDVRGAQDEVVAASDVVSTGNVASTTDVVAIEEGESSDEDEIAPLDVHAFAEQIRRDFAAADDAGQSTEVDENIEAPLAARDEEVAADDIATSGDVDQGKEVDQPLAGDVDEIVARDTPTDTVETVREPVADPDESTPPSTTLAAIEQSPELRQLADLQARIAAALQDPSSLSRNPVLPPDAQLVSDPASAMSAAARRARLIAEMLDTTEPLEEEAEREAQSIDFDVAEPTELPSIEAGQAVDAPMPIADEYAADVPVDIHAEAPADDEAASTAGDGVLADLASPELKIIPEPIDASDTLPADLARGDETVAAPVADVIASELVTEYPAASEARDDEPVDVPSFAMPSAIELSELPAFETSSDVEFKAQTPAPSPVADLELPAAEALDAPLDLDEASAPLAEAEADETRTPPERQQDVFDVASADRASIASRVVEPSETSGITEETAAIVELEAEAPVDPALADQDEIRDAAAPIDEPVSTSPTIDAGEPVSESANDVLHDAGVISAAVAVDFVEPIAVEPDSVENVELEPIANVELERAEDVEAEFAQPVEPVAEALPEESALEIEPLSEPADVVAQPDEQAVEVDESIAPIEADHPQAGEVIAIASDVAPEASAIDEGEPELTAVESTPTDAVAAQVESPLAEAIDEPVAAADRVIVEAEEEEPLEGQSRPLIAADEHLIDDEFDELRAIHSLESMSVAGELSVVEPGETVAGEPFVDTSAESGPSAMEPMVAEGTVEEAKAPTNITPPQHTSVVNVNVPSLDKLQAEFDDAFADALAMADGASFAGTKPAEPSKREVPSNRDVPSVTTQSIESQKPDQAENGTDLAQPKAPFKPSRQPGVIDLKVPTLDELETQYKDSFADALAMAEGQSFARPAAEVRPPAQGDVVEGSDAKSAPPVKARRPAPEFKLDESLLDQAEKMGPLGGSAAAIGPAAFMNLGGIGWIGDPTLDDYELPSERKQKAKPRRSRQRRPVSEPRPPTLVEQPATGETPLPTEIPAAASEPIASAVSPGSADVARVEPPIDPSVEAVLEGDEPVAPKRMSEMLDALNGDGAPIGSETLDGLSADDLDESFPEIDADASPIPTDEVPTVEGELSAAQPEETQSRPAEVPTILPPRPTRSARPRKGEAIVDQAISASGTSPFAAQELPLVDAFSQTPMPQLDEVLARLNTSGGAVKDHPPISQDRPVGEPGVARVPASPFASQIPIAQPAGSVRRVRQRVSKLPLITLLMVGAIGVTGMLTWFIPVPRTVRGEVTFRNLNNVVDLIRKDKQAAILAKLGDTDLRRAARTHLEDMYGNGFLDKGEDYVEIVRNARFDSKNPQILVIEVPSNVNQASADQKRLGALLSEFVKANKDLSDQVNTMTDELREIERSQAKYAAQLAELQKRDDELRIVGDNGTVVSGQLKKVERELATLDESRKQATRAVDESEAELQRLEKQMLSSGIGYRGMWMRPVQGVVLADASGAAPSTQPVDAQADLIRLRREREDVKARLERLTAARSPETAAARNSFDEALEAFSKQVENARNALGDRPEVLEYVQSATRLQDQIREMTDTLVRRQEQQITRLAEFQMRLKELTAANQEQRINGDPQMKEWMDRLSFQERRLNVAKESNVAAEEIGDIERDIAFLKSSISAQQEVLANPKESSIVGELEKMIGTTKKDMAADRERNEVLLAEVQNAFKSRQPVLEALPVEQRQAAENLTERLAQINLARQRYTDSLAAVAGTDESLIADAKKQVEALDAAITSAEARVQQSTLAQSQEMEKRTEIAKRVDDARAKLLAARAAREEIEKQYYAKLEARDALTAKANESRAAMVERDSIGPKIESIKTERSALIARKVQIEERVKYAVVPEPPAEPHVLSNSQSDPRWKYFGMSFLGIFAIGMVCMALEVRNRIPTPRSSDEPASDEGPLSHTPTVA